MSCEIVSGVSMYSIEKGNVNDKETIDQSETRFPSKQKDAQNLNLCQFNDSKDNKKNNNNNEDVNDTRKRSASETFGDERKKKMKKTRRKKRKWNVKRRMNQWKDTPERDAKRSDAKGARDAPDNTTQFIMNDHCEREIDFDEIQLRMQRMGHQRRVENDDGDPRHADGEDFYSSPEDESEYLQQQFYETYDNIHAERLNSMSKNELVQEYMMLENRVEDLEKRLKESQSLRTNAIDGEAQTDHNRGDYHQNRGDYHLRHNSTEDSSLVETNLLKDEIRKLNEENIRLKNENEKLQNVSTECSNDAHYSNNQQLRTECAENIIGDESKG